MHLSDECAQDNNSIHAPVMMVARVLLYFFKIVSANLKKKLLNTPWSALFATRSNVTCSKVPQQSGGALSATMAHEQAKKKAEQQNTRKQPGSVRGAQPLLAQHSQATTYGLTLLCP